MAELTEITEAVHTAFGQDLELVFGPGISPDLAGPELRVGLLPGYAARAAGGLGNPADLFGRLGAGRVVHPKAPLG